MCCPNLSIEKRFLPATEVRKEHLNPTVQACIRAQAYCTGYVFYPSHVNAGRRCQPDRDE